MKKNNKYLIKTPNGFKKFEGISRSIHNSGLKFFFDDNTTISVTKDHLFKEKDDWGQEVIYVTKCDNFQYEDYDTPPMKPKDIM